MDFKALKELLDGYGMPLAALAVVVVGLWIAFWRIFNKVWKAGENLAPLAKSWFLNEQVEREKRIDSMNAIIETQKNCALTLQDTNRVVHSIDDRQTDPKSMTHMMIGKLLRNDSKAAHAGIVAMEAIAEHQPELRPKLQQAIDVLRQVERDDA